MIVVDGNNVSYRYKRPPFVVFDKKEKCMVPAYTNGKGIATGTIYGVLTTCLGLIKHFNDSKLIVCWDSKYNLRKSESGYKANRDHSKDGFIMEQMTILHSILPFFGFNSVKVYGYEADDIAYTFGKSNKNVIFYSEDLDYTQLVNKDRNNRVYRKHVIVDTPLDFNYQVFHALTGSKKDNVIGIPYFKKKIAMEFAKKHNSIEQVIKKYSSDYPDMLKYKRILLQNFDLLTPKKVPSLSKHIRAAAYTPIVVNAISHWLNLSNMADRIDDLWR